jgi:hypothetical protein
VFSERLVRGLLDAAGVGSWSELPGRVVRACVSPTRGVMSVGHAIEEIWLDLDDPAKIEDDMSY